MLVRRIYFKWVYNCIKTNSVVNCATFAADMHKRGGLALIAFPSPSPPTSDIIQSRKNRAYIHALCFLFFFFFIVNTVCVRTHTVVECFAKPFKSKTQQQQQRVKLNFYISFNIVSPFCKKKKINRNIRT